MNKVIKEAMKESQFSATGVKPVVHKKCVTSLTEITKVSLLLALKTGRQFFPQTF